MFDLKGHIRSNKAIYVYIFSSNNSSVKPLLSLYASLSLLFFSLSLFPPPPLPPLPSTPYISVITTLTEAADKKFLLLNVSLLSSPLLLVLSLYACLSLFPLSFFFSISFFPPLLPSPSLTLSLCLSIFSP